MVLFRLHQYQGAQDLYARAYDIQSSKLGPEDKEVATTMNNTAGLLKAMGKLADAEVVYRTVSPTCVFLGCHVLLVSGLRLGCSIFEHPNFTTLFSKLILGPQA